MIKVKDNKVTVKGLAPDLLADYTLITRSLVDALQRTNLTKEDAEKMVAEAHRIGCMTEEELDLELKEKLWKILERAQEELRKEWVEENE